MKFWIDAQLPPALAAWQGREFAADASPVRDLGLRDAKDEAIFTQARSPGLVVVTKDVDFVHLLERHGLPPQVLWVTCGNASNAALKELLAARFEAARRMPEPGEPVVEISDALRGTRQSAG